MKDSAPSKEEDAPESCPQNDGDRYLKKRLIIAGSSYQDKKVLERLTVDTYIDMVLEPDNPYDRDAVALFFEGEKIGYVPKAEKRPFVACLKLKRGIYGVITDIDESEYPTKYEFEVWQEA